VAARLRGWVRGSVTWARCMGLRLGSCRDREASARFAGAVLLGWAARTACRGVEHGLGGVARHRLRAVGVGAERRARRDE
jgi:hypothetical protein